VRCVHSEITMHVTHSERVFRLRYTASKAHVPCCHLWPAQLYNIFPHNLTKGKISEKNDLSWSVYRFTTISSRTFLILRRTEWYVIKMCTDLFVKFLLYLSDFNFFFKETPTGALYYSNLVIYTNKPFVSNLICYC